WAAPDRKAMPGASISVFGTTFYEHPWFGAAVQWVGLVYAESLSELANYDTSYDWLKLAGLIVQSAAVQQKAPGAKCGHPGLFPDSYQIVRGEDYYEWCLSPMGILSGLVNQAGYPAGPRPHSLRAGEQRVSVLGPAWPLAGEWNGGTLRLKLRMLPHLASQVLLLNLAEPKRVTWNGAELARGVRPGWRPAEREQGLVVALDPAEAVGELVVEGAAALAYHNPQIADTLINGGFEDGLTGWGGDPSAQIDTAQPRGGKAALSLDAPADGHESQANAQPVAVDAGKRYRLRAWVKQLAGDGDYKVTLDWLDAAGGHLAYANDWAGTNRPREYTEHGGVFTAPAGAAQVRIILGCRGARVLFDDVSFEAAP
ncbi:MAG: carbohydrate binding domain-containing protein, partial [Armatimonadetes bacterium]|nr:carbohydrate binding domain-containing protein [Armatimonadota bacterium]